MGKALVELPDGRKAQIEYDTPEQLNAAILDLAQPKGSTSTGWGEAALTFGSSMVATPVAGIAGLATAGAKALGLTGADPADVVRNTQSAFTYQPRTQAGQTATNIVSYPFEKLAQVADWLGQQALDATGSPAIAAGVNTGVQFLPAFALKARPKAAPAAGAQTAAPGAVAAPTAAKAAEAAAREFVSRSTSLDWNSLPSAFRQSLTDVAKDARRLSALDPAAVERQGRLASLDVPVPATRGQLIRDPVALRNEGNVAATNAGAPIRGIYDDANRALISNLDVLRGRVTGRGKTAATARTAEDAGRSIQDSALRAKAQAAQRDVNAAYSRARATEPNAEVSAQPIYDLLDGSPEITRLGWVDSWLKKARVSKTETTDGISVDTQRGVKLRELDDLRKRAVSIARAGGTDAVYAGDVIRAIDSAMNEVPAGAAAWRAARDAHKAMKKEFADQGAVADLVDNYPNSADRRVALENTTKRIVGGSLEDIRSVKRSLLTGGDAASRTAGRKAWRDLRAQVIQQIRDEATKGVATLPDGSPNLSAAQLKRAVERIGPDRMNEIFGPGTSQRINRVVAAAQDVKTVPPVAVPVGSSTVQNALALLERSLDKVPVVGGPVADTLRGVAQVRNIGANARAAKQAVRTPVDEAAQASRNALVRKEAASKVKRNALATTPATAPREQRR